MTIAALIVSTLALIISVICISIMLAKNFFSTHQVQMVPIDPMKGMNFGEVGKSMTDPFRELGDDVTPEELEEIGMMKTKKGIKI